jgi:hypothetical protein
MASRKKNKKKIPKKSAGYILKVKRKCSACGKRGHNVRSHDPGGKLA